MFGTGDQKKKYLPKVTRGEWIASGAFTESAHGSDITLMDTTAVLDGDEYVINGTKTLISNATIADFAVALCQTKPEAGRRGQSVFVVYKGTEGFEATKIAGKMGLGHRRQGSTHSATCVFLGKPSSVLRIWGSTTL